MFRSKIAQSNISSLLSSKKLPEQRYASLAGKSRFSKEEQESFELKEKNRVVDAHAQYITDFDIIYKNKKDIRLYQIGSLHTKKHKDTPRISENDNYSLKTKSQHIQYFKEPILVKKNIWVVKNSKDYFEKKNISETIESHEHYKSLKKMVIEELTKKNVSFRIAMSPEDLKQTGYNVLLDDAKKNNTFQEVNHMNELPYHNENDL